MEMGIVDAFCIWWAMGENRSLELLAKQCGFSLPALRVRASNECWEGRRWALDRVLENEDGDPDDMRTRHMLTVEFVKGRAAEALTRLSSPPRYQVDLVPGVKPP